MTARTPGLFVTATGTDAGKTWFTLGLTKALVAAGLKVAAIKPVETGVEVDPLDATALGAACGRPELSSLPGLYRVPPPLAPLAATLEGHPAPPSATALTSTIQKAAAHADFLVVEGAGGLRVPLSRDETMSDLGRALGLPIVVVAPNRLGVLSHLETALVTAEHDGLVVRAVVLMDTEAGADHSRRTNHLVIAERSDVPTFCVPQVRSPEEVASHLGPALHTLLPQSLRDRLPDAP